MFESLEARWTAFVDRRPPGPATLRVIGRLQMPTPGFAVALARGESQGGDPRDLLLELTIGPPDGIVAQVVTEVVVTYAEPADAGVGTVTIVPGGPSIPVGEAG